MFEQPHEDMHKMPENQVLFSCPGTYDKPRPH